MFASSYRGNTFIPAWQRQYTHMCLTEAIHSYLLWLYSNYPLAAQWFGPRLGLVETDEHLCWVHRLSSCANSIRTYKRITRFCCIPFVLQADLTAVNAAHAHVIVCACTFWEDFTIHCTWCKLNVRTNQPRPWMRKPKEQIQSARIHLVEVRNHWFSKTCWHVPTFHAALRVYLT